MYEAVNIVNTNACTKATISSIAIINIVNNVDPTAAPPAPTKLSPDLPNMKKV